MPEPKIDQTSYFAGAVDRIGEERKKDAVNIAHADAEELLQEMYREKGNTPVPPGLKVNNKILGEWTRKAVIENKEIQQTEVEIYCNAFEERFSQGYPNRVM